jgi:hypothetical protein
VMEDLLAEGLSLRVGAQISLEAKAAERGREGEGEREGEGVETERERDREREREVWERDHVRRERDHGEGGVTCP